MTIFLLLLGNLLPLYLIIAAGFLVGRAHTLDRETLANIAIYLCVPVVQFGFILNLDLKPSYIALPFITYTLSALIGLGFLRLGHVIFKDNRANLAALCASMGNGGYFGLPLVMLLFPPNLTGIYMFLLLGSVLYEGTIGYYIAARGRFTVRESFRKLAKIPYIYAALAGVMFNVNHVRMPDLFFTYWAYFKGAYIIIGMMIIGASLARMNRLVVAPRFLAVAFFGKFIVWPAMAGLFIWVDQTWLHQFEPVIHHLLFIFAIVPFAANIAAFAAQMDMRPEKAATTVLLGTVFALFYIPFMLWAVGFQTP